MTSRIPPLLEPYLRLPPEASLLVLTGVVGASTNWLVHRFLCSFLGSSPSSDRHAAPDAASPDTAYPDDAVSVVLVSFLRDYAFWKEGAGKTGVDLDLLARKGRFVYVDGLGRLFSDPKAPAAQPATSGSPGSRVLANATLAELRKQVLEAVTSLQHQGLGSKVVLVLDSPDLMLAASGEAMPVVALQDVLLDVREKVHSSVVTLAADEPLVSAQTTTLEKEHAALAVSMAHEADMVMSLRMLDTGTAKDVSGVLRVTRGGAAAAAAVEERELLYFVGGDGSIRVFERGQ